MCALSTAATAKITITTVDVATSLPDFMVGLFWGPVTIHRRSVTGQCSDVGRLTGSVATRGLC